MHGGAMLAGEISRGTRSIFIGATKRCRATARFAPRALAQAAECREGAME
jgi:hypothetical protein